MVEKTERQEINKKRATRMTILGLGGALFLGEPGFIGGVALGFLLPIKTRGQKD